MNSDIQHTLRMLIDIVIKMSICVLGLGTNTTNIVVFLQIGLKDSITVSFFGLAFAELGFVFFTFIYQLFESLDSITMLKPEVDYRSLAYILNLCAFFFVDMSVLITVYTSLQKCACVALPFLIKNIFTPTRSSCILYIMYLIMLIYYLPLLISSGLIQKFDEQLNRTRFMLPLSDEQKEMLAIFKIFNRMIIPISSIVLVTASLAVMAVKLVKASNLRHAMTKVKADPATNGRKGRTNSQLSSNELKAIQAVFLVSAIFVTCNLPDVVSFLVSVLMPDFGDYGSYRNSFRLTRAVQNVLAVTNATVNIFVYFKYNSKYRSQMLADFGRHY